MPEQLTPSIPITLDRLRLLKCDFNAVALISQYTGRNLFAGDNFLGSVLDVTDEEGNVSGHRVIVDPMCLRGVLAALLALDDASITPEKAGRLITASNMPEILEKCSEAVAAFFGKKPTEEAASAAPLAPTATT